MDHNQPSDRRGFLASLATALAALTTAPPAWAADSGMPYRKLGRTGEKVSAIGLGGYHIGSPKEENEGIRLIRTAIDGGINFMDNCWDYHDGRSEVIMGKALRDGYRQKVFLMTKTDGQDRKSCARQLDECLQRLQTDRIDLVQFHEVIRPGDPDKLFGPDGAWEALSAAKKAGKIRFIGFTGHKAPDIHLAMLARARKAGARMDAVQMPLNVLDHHFNSFEQKVLPVLVKEEIGVLGMKPLASGAVLKSGKATAEEALTYAMSLPTSVVITGCDSMDKVEQALRVAKGFKPMPAGARKALLDRTREVALTGNFEKFKTSTQFDGTVHNPHWLG